MYIYTHKPVASPGQSLSTHLGAEGSCLHLRRHQRGHRGDPSQGVGARLLPPVPSRAWLPAPGGWMRGPPGSNSTELFPAPPAPQHLPVHGQKHHRGPTGVPAEGGTWSPPVTPGWGRREDKNKPPGQDKAQQTGWLAHKPRAAPGQRSLRKSQLVPPFLYFYASPKKKYITLPSPAPATGSPRQGPVLAAACVPCPGATQPGWGVRGASSPRGLHLQHRKPPRMDLTQPPPPTPERPRNPSALLILQR